MADQLDSVYWKLVVIRCQVGDRSAFEELVARYQARLQGFLFKLIGGRETVEDLAQEVWMDVFRDLPKLNDPGAFLPWFYRIVRNLRVSTIATAREIMPFDRRSGRRRRNRRRGRFHRRGRGSRSCRARSTWSGASRSAALAVC